MSMFSKKRKQPKCPIPEERREWLEYAFGWLVVAFGEQAIRSRRVLIPHYTDFPVRYNGELQSALDTIGIVARQMEIDPNEIELFIYTEGVREVSTGGPFGNTLYTTGSGSGSGDGLKFSSGRYFGREVDGKYHIALEEGKLKQPEFMVAVLAHELSHIKLLGEGRLEENNEQLTDLNTIIFGVGVFNANTAFSTHQDFRSSGWQKLGYLTQMDWGYALALFARLRRETDPVWAEHLCKNVRSDFLKNQLYLAAF
jgi:hypothetical protein